jgi:hypothetical protein
MSNAFMHLSIDQTIMELMLQLVTESSDPQQRPGIAANIAALLTDSGAIISSLFDLLESEDAATAVGAVHVLRAVHLQASDALAACVLAIPTGITRLMDLLADRSREALRNEAVLLLRELTATHNAELARMVAFQEGFERLFAIMDSDDMVAGGELVRDCLDACCNVLAGGAVTQALFCESTCLSVLHQLIDVRWLAMAAAKRAAAASAGAAAAAHSLQQELSAVEPPLATAVQLDIMTRAVALLRLLLSKGSDSSARAQHQRALGRAAHGLLAELLVHVAFSRAAPYCRTPSSVRAAAAAAVGELADGHTDNQVRVLMLSYH